MKNVLLALSIALLPFSGSAQSFLTQSGTGDTMKASYMGGADMAVYNTIKSASSTPVTITWKVTDSHLDAGWAITGFCDNIQCYGNDATAFPPLGELLNGGGDVKVSNPYTSSYGDFHALFTCASAAGGSSSWLKVNANDVSNFYSRDLYFIAMKNPTGVTTTIVSSDDVTIYPNPAREAVNVLYNRNADVRSIAVFNLIGKMVGPLYRTSSATSAKIQLTDMPNGVYFIRLMNSKGNVVATRRFTKQ
ncbi:MAG: T9SS type A sorting domain-containing protein [Bacteroidetes bacterium]|nr:T9SS type A sorting domain-containing protein [Bacteroidota bacterium]